MERNQFLLYNEILYRLNRCRTVRALSLTLLNQLKLLIPYTYASVIPIQVDPTGGEVVHGEPVSVPTGFIQVEKAWGERTGLVFAKEERIAADIGKDTVINGEVP